MDLWIVAPWGEYKIAPLNFEQYAKQYYPNDLVSHVPKTAYAHWINMNNYHHLSEFSLDEMSVCELVWIGSADAFKENLDGRKENEG